MIMILFNNIHMQMYRKRKDCLSICQHVNRSFVVIGDGIIRDFYSFF